MRKALVIGIDYYEKEGIGRLYGCVNDAHSVKAALERNSDGTVNFSVKILTGSGPGSVVNKSGLLGAIKDLFDGDPEIALLYFAGHGHLESTGGAIVATDSSSGTDGVSLHAILALAAQSDAKNRILIFDSCHSGSAGAMAGNEQDSILRDGTTILTASTPLQYASEQNGKGVFTELLVDALNGAASNLVGDITPGAIYAHIDQSLGPWEQRPVFKTNVKSFVSLRTVDPPINLEDLRKITSLFPSPGFEFPLDPSFEPERSKADKDLPEPNPQNTTRFEILQKYNRVNLVVPVDAPHMWHAAIDSKACKLTVLGEHYRRLVERNRI